MSRQCIFQNENFSLYKSQIEGQIFVREKETNNEGAYLEKSAVDNFIKNLTQIPENAIGYIAGINISALVKKLRLLHQDKKLLLHHLSLGDHIVYMNPQHNVLYADPVRKTTNKLSEEGHCIDKLLLWDCGEWYIYSSKPVICEHCGSIKEITDINELIKYLEKV